MQQMVVLTALEQSPRLEQALSSLETTLTPFAQHLPMYKGKRVLFALSLDEAGLNAQLYALLHWLRAGCVLKDCICGLVIDADTELFTKALACQLALAINMAGGTLLGQPLVEATASLANMRIQAKNNNCTPIEAYERAVLALFSRLRDFDWEKKREPNLLVLHASTHASSNTMDFWRMAKEHLAPFSITEIGLRNGAVEDCSGCPYTMCLHFGERGGCFYGGVIVQEVYPALEACDGLLILCPNYNDAASANITAFINRLTAVYRSGGGLDKALFSIVVSGYSGGDVVASQLISGLCMNKGFVLPPHAFQIETANFPNELRGLPDIEKRAAQFAQSMRSWLFKEENERTINSDEG